MKITFTENVFIEGKPYAIGDVLDTDDRTGGYLISINRAVRTPDAPKKKTRHQTRQSARLLVRLRTRRDHPGRERNKWTPRLKS